MDVEINVLGVFAAGVASMLVGGIWYSDPVFGKIWKKLEKIDDKKAKAGAAKALAGMVVLALLTGYVLAHVTYLSSTFFPDYSYQNAALTSAFWMWVGFVLPVTASNSLFNQAPWKLTAIHAGNWFATLLGMGLVIGLFGI